MSRKHLGNEINIDGEDRERPSKLLTRGFSELTFAQLLRCPTSAVILNDTISKIQPSEQEAYMTMKKEQVKNQRRLGFVVLSLICWLFAGMAASYAVVEFVIVERNPRSEDNKYAVLRNETIIKEEKQLWGATDTSPLAKLDDEEWRVFLGCVIWVTVMLAGFGTEMLVYVTIILRKGWSAKEDSLWMLAHFFFPFFSVLYLGLGISHNFMALVFLVAGLWKFGFPETIFYQYLALYGEGPLVRALADPGKIDLPKSHLYQHLSLHGDYRSRLGRMSDFLNGTGTVLHHGAASFVVSMFLADVIVPDRHAISCCLILVMQHWFALLQPASLIVYMLVETFLEVCFEWIIFSDFQYIANNHWTASMATAAMLFAHWQYFIAGGLDLCSRSFAPESTDDDSSQRPEEPTMHDSFLNHSYSGKAYAEVPLDRSYGDRHAHSPGFGKIEDDEDEESLLASEVFEPTLLRHMQKIPTTQESSDEKRQAKRAPDLEAGRIPSRYPRPPSLVGKAL